MSMYSSAAIWSGITHIGVMTSMMLRNIIFARFLDPTDFATALTFGLILSLFEYISNFGHENLMQRSSSGNHPSFQATVHSTIILRGTIVAITIVLIAPLIPKLLNLHGNKFNYAWLALIPFVSGFIHSDHQRFHRQHNYTVTAKVHLTADVSSIGVAVICMFVWDNYWAFYFSSLYRHLGITVLSHIWAQRDYTLAFNTRHIRSLISFGLPLILVGVLKAISMEFDKAIVARIAGLETFATYVLTLILIMNGTNIVSVALSKIFIRRVSTANSNLSTVVSSNGIIYCFLIFPLLIILCLLGEDLIQLIFGKQYQAIDLLIFVVCSMVGIRSLNQWLNQTVIGTTSTKLMLFSDMVRVCAAIIGVYVVYASNDVIKIAVSFCLAELAYFMTLTFLLHKKFPIAKASISILFMFAIFMAATYVLYRFSYESSLILKLLLTSLAVCLISAVFLASSVTCRNQTADLLKPLMAKMNHS